MGHLKSNKQFQSIVLLKNSVHSSHIFVQVQTLEQTLFNFSILRSSRFPPKKFNQLSFRNLFRSSYGFDENKMKINCSATTWTPPSTRTGSSSTCSRPRQQPLFPEVWLRDVNFRLTFSSVSLSQVNTSSFVQHLRRFNGYILIFFSSSQSFHLLK